ncbi:MAG: M1 family metallopeptidase [Chitinophagaceae bacterium]|nr:M1 family metallopeptidase [Chitinophagaceae bacterium]
MRKLFICCCLFAVLSVSCSMKHKLAGSGQLEMESTAMDDPYALPSSDSLSYEFGDDAIVVTPRIYRASYTIINDLVHTKLEVSFDWSKTYLYGKAWITLAPHFYPTDSLRLDAKGFDIHKVELSRKSGNVALKYSYDSSTINIQLDKTYIAGEQYTVFIDYTSKPNDLKLKGSAAINEAKGLYFINPDGKDPDKPRQVWTQGETESNSCWFPTIDKPNMKMTTEISMTVEKGFVTLSNGLMTSSKDNGNGTHTDTWKLDLPYAPYLVMMTAGPFAIVKDHWKNMEVNYYVDKKYESYAKAIFGNTPEMIDFFSTKLGVPFAWPKYSQVVVHDYVSGAMENVSASLFYERLHQTAREMIDGKREDIISHELFHQWFGDLVTCESWSNITVNESFADYGEYLWYEYKYGRDVADSHLDDDLQQYIYMSRSGTEPLVRFDYSDKEDVFDAISYQKGGRILHMLRNYVGDAAFFLSLNKYLTDHRFGAAEAHDLRLAFESVTGQDLNWFFNQWYFSKGHPDLNISYDYDSDEKMEIVSIHQLQDTQDGTPVFRLPVKIDVYEAGKVTRYSKVITDAFQEFSFPCSVPPDLVNVDADKILVCEKTDNKSDSAFAFQLKHAPLYMDRFEALNFFAKNSSSPLYEQAMLQGMNDKFADIRRLAVESIRTGAEEENGVAFMNRIKELAMKDSSSYVRAAAMENMAAWGDPSVVSILENGLHDSSYLVISTALKAMVEVDSVKAYAAASVLENDSSEDVRDGLETVYARMAGPEKNAFFISQLTGNSVSYYTTVNYGQYLSRWADNVEVIQEALPLLYTISEKNAKWYVRLAATNALENVYSAMDANKETYTNALMQEEINTGEKQKLMEKLDWTNHQMTEIEDKVGAIKAAETNEHLKMIYGR